MTAAARIAMASADTPADIAAVTRLFVEYAESLNFSLCFQGFDAEITAMPGRYAPPRGRLLLARVDGAAAGAVGLRPLDGDICEMKRLYVCPAFRGLGLGRRLAEAILARGREIGYERMRLDTLATMSAARALYGDLGFVEISPYNDNPLDDVRYYECALGERS